MTKVRVKGTLRASAASVTAWVNIDRGNKAKEQALCASFSRSPVDFFTGASAARLINLLISPLSTY